MGLSRQTSSRGYEDRKKSMGKKMEQQQVIIRERRVKGNMTDKSKWEHKDRAAA